MRTISELLTILRDNADVNGDKIHAGLCFEVDELSRKNIISISEKELLQEYIEENMPERIISNIYTTFVSAWGWTVSEWPPRLKWLNKHIKLNLKK